MTELKTLNPTSELLHRAADCDALAADAERYSAEYAAWARREAEQAAAWRAEAAALRETAG